MNKPFFSIIIPTYNRADLIKTAIYSLINQTFQNFEIIVVDDGSIDNTEKVVKKIRDSRIRYFKKENEERSIARNFGINKAQGKYIGFLDADDYMLSHHLESTYNYIQNNNNIMVLHTGYEIRDENNNFISKVNSFSYDIKNTILQDNHLICNSITVKIEVLKKNNFINDKYAVFSEDWYLWIVLASKYKFHFLTDTTSIVVQHKNRSLNQLNSLKIKKSLDLVVSNLLNQKSVIKQFNKNHLNYFIAERYLFCSYTALSQKYYILFFTSLLKAIYYKPDLVIKRLKNKLIKGS